jgi:Mn-dependent DtxR family transcriptional regulator
MVTQKYRKIMKEVFKIVKKEEPITTGLIAKELKVNWATAQRSLDELEKKGKVKGKSVSGRNIWIIK